MKARRDAHRHEHNSDTEHVPERADVIVPVTRGRRCLFEGIFRRCYNDRRADLRTRVPLHVSHLINMNKTNRAQLVRLELFSGLLDLERPAGMIGTTL